ncbi:dimer_Tnp_hAT domain-containing protein [Trichonephila clavipes]|nr:dimer_Tnp_hAT domain-containing protein [Trichonephila clavipes]
MEFNSRYIWLFQDTGSCYLTIFSSTYACESLFSEMNNIEDSLRHRLEDNTNSACILVKVTFYNPNTSYLSSNPVIRNPRFTDQYHGSTDRYQSVDQMVPAA